MLRPSPICPTTIATVTRIRHHDAVCRRVGADLMNVSIAPEQEEYIRRKVETGPYSDSSDVIREALRLMQEREIGGHPAPSKKDVVAALKALEAERRIPEVSTSTDSLRIDGSVSWLSQCRDHLRGQPTAAGRGQGCGTRDPLARDRRDRQHPPPRLRHRQARHPVGH